MLRNEVIWGLGFRVVASPDFHTFLGGFLGTFLGHWDIEKTRKFKSPRIGSPGGQKLNTIPGSILHALKHKKLDSGGFFFCEIHLLINE